MQTIDKTPDLVGQIQAFETFQDIPSEALEWMVANGEYVLYQAGENLFYPDMPVEYMQIIVKGRYVIYLERDGKRREAGVWGAGHVTGVLPFSRMKKAGGFGRVLEDCYVLRLHKKYFVEMVQVSYELVQNLVAVMSSRIRDFSQLRFQDEKLMALGKLSAGLAHELNNPAAAMVRSAEELYKRQHQTPEKFKSVITMAITPQQTDEINAILFKRIAEYDDDATLPLIERQSMEDDLEDWLDDHGIVEHGDLIETFTNFRVTADDLDQMEAILDQGSGEAIQPILHWFESSMSLELLVKEIQESAKRISELVQSVKNYSHMDRALTKEPTDVQEGIKNTLTMLKHKLKKQEIAIEKSCSIELPKVMAFGGQLNQVWTNLIDNAIDAMPDGGTLGVDIYADRDKVCVDISDTGTGIPEDIATRIFEPFFTTKAMDEGTGMGLDISKKIVDRHDGQIRVASEPGKTVFMVCFPEIKD
ncbi:MAG: ATP-binding protein [Bacteroidota bacterium]